MAKPKKALQKVKGKEKQKKAKSSTRSVEKISKSERINPEEFGFDSTHRSFPLLTIDQEKAVFYLLAGKSTKEVSELICYSVHTIYHWRTAQEFKEAMEKQGSLMIERQKETFYHIISEAYNTIRAGVTGETANPFLALKLLKETGSMPISSETAANDPEIQKIAEDLLAEAKEKAREEIRIEMGLLK